MPLNIAGLELVKLLPVAGYMWSTVTDCFFWAVTVFQLAAFISVFLNSRNELSRGNSVAHCIHG